MFNEIKTNTCFPKSIVERNYLEEQQTVLQFTKVCWDKYKARLEKLPTPEKYLELGEIEFDFSNENIIKNIFDFGIYINNVSLSVTSDGSLHYIFRFENGIILSIATFLNLDKSNKTLIDLYLDNKPILSINSRIDNGLEMVKEKIQDHTKCFTFSPFLEGLPDSKNLECV